MKRWNITLLLLPVAISLAFLVSGCYTQLGTVRNDRHKDVKEEEYTKEEEYADQEEYAEEDSVSENAYQDARHRFYSEGYYPYIGIGYGYYDPWYWGYGSYYYSPYWYDPIWGWCGTSYPRYYASGYWGGRPYNSWYTRGYYTYRTGGKVVTRPGGAYGATRTFGTTRTPMGGTRSGPDMLPSGARAGSGLGKSGSDGTSISRSGARRGDSRPAGSGSSPRYGGTREGSRSSSSGTNNRGGVRRYDSPPSYTPAPAPSSGNSGGGSSGRSGGSSAPASSPAPSSSGGGHAPSNTGQRGGERR